MHAKTDRKLLEVGIMDVPPGNRFYLHAGSIAAAPEQPGRIIGSDIAAGKK
jgi:hypothetical protein